MGEFFGEFFFFLRVKKVVCREGKKKRKPSPAPTLASLFLSLLLLLLSPRLKLPTFLSPMLNEPRLPSPWLPLPVLPLLFIYLFFWGVLRFESRRGEPPRECDFFFLPLRTPSFLSPPPPLSLQQREKTLKKKKTHPRLLSPLLPHPTLFAPWLGAHFSSPGFALAAGTAQGAPCLKASA